MISFLLSPALTHRSMKISEHVRQYAAQQGISDEEALEKGMEEKSKEFAEAGAEVYVPA
jgi:phosphomethylpyrimidine synthase